jgi:hypothetical protein
MTLVEARVGDSGYSREILVKKTIKVNNLVEERENLFKDLPK